MARLFQAYLMVDWSAASKPVQGENSVWIGLIKRDARFRPTFEAHNPKTRKEAEALIRELIDDRARRNERVLVGFDFPLGYPAGTAAALKLKSHYWRAMWDFLTSAVVDKKDNLNNRATVAARMNRLISDDARPFWGTPRAADATTHLSKTKPADTAGLPEFRAAEQATRGRGKAGAKSVWQIHGQGSVGGQALLGVPAVKRLVDGLDGRARVWPFETGWKALTPADLDGVAAVIAEIYPALSTVTPDAGETPDRAQVRTLCEQFARMDERGELAKAFAAPKGTDEATVQRVQDEEGWILGA